MPDDDRIEEIVERALRRKADSAPSERGLAARVRARLARRRRRQVAGATVACLAIVAGFVGFAQFGDAGRDDIAGPDGDPGRTGSDWRWESYGNVEVQVPRDWSYGTTDEPPCLQGRQPPYVGRPGAVRSILCPEDVPPLDQRVPYLWFDSAQHRGVQTYDAGWIAETRTIDSVRVTVLADDPALRRRILDSVRPIKGTDSHGCLARHYMMEGPMVGNPDDGGLATVGEVEAVSACRYSVPAFMIDPEERLPLLSSSRLTGSAAQQLVDAILAAPEGSGPNDPGQCTPDARYGDELVLLRVWGSAHDQEVYVRYSGCDGHGTNDGVTRRKLTAPVLQAILTGPHRPTSLQGSLARLLDW